MQNTSERIDFIADYLSNYESKIQLLNSCGLFDAAVHFELFAQEVCKLWFVGKQFSNLNIDTYTYPCADLISDDKSIFVQVSTTSNVSAKITKTLESIQKLKKPDIASIKNIKFFMLYSSNVSHIKDKTVGTLTFTKQSDLITTRMVLEKAKTDLNFQTALYQLFQRDAVLKTDFDKLNEAIEKSKFDISEIVHLINGEYEIDRSEQINKILIDKAKNTAILGQAGYGKSVICKKIIENKANVLYARAERFIEERDINGIWGFNIKNVLNVSAQPFVFFIDSLEFIADSYTKNNLLPYLFEITKGSKNVQIIVSCRTTDYNAFLKITSQYQIQTYEVVEVSAVELIRIAKKYPIIQKLNTSSGYAQLLKSPLYINLIISKITDFTNIKNENDFREYVWENIICLNDSEAKAIIKKIVFSRAKDFLLNVSIDDFNSAKIAELVSANILLRKGSLVRLKLDVFEDICFERYFDDEFNKCRGEYVKFFEAISTMGRCVYRRYQIWVSNKILCKDNRDAIINSLVFSNITPDGWKKGTMIGLVRSRFSREFFAENADAIIKSGLIDRFIHLTNLYGFEINNSWFAKYSQVICLAPSGQGRYSLIEIVYKKDIYKADSKFHNGILKLISDYCKLNDNKNEATTLCAVKILEYYLENDIKEISGGGKKDLYQRHEHTIPLLKPLYQLSEGAKELIVGYWRQLDEWYKGDKERYAEEIIEFTLGFENSVLAYSLPDELCALGKMFWTYQRPKEKDEYDFGMRSFRDKHERCWKFGLSEQAEQYESKHHRDTPTESGFFHTLFYRSFWKGLRWTVAFINESVSCFQANCPKECFEWEIQFIDDGITRNYLGDASMWLATIEAHHFPTLLSDLLFCLQDMIKQIIEGKYTKDVSAFAEKVRKYIYENSNNIALLAIISNLGIRFQKELPGYALDLATNSDIIHLDFQRKTRMMPNQMIEFLENQMMTAVGIPELNRRYMRKREKTDDLQEYVFNTQIFGDKGIKEKCFQILDYLYSVVPNDAENATEHLQIQKMDLRTAKVERVDERTVAISPSISGEAEKVVTRHGEILKPQAEVAYKLLELQKKYEADKSAVMSKDYIEAIDLILGQRDNFQLPSAFDRELAAFIGLVLVLDKTLVKEQREKYCQILIDGAKGYLLNARGYQFDIDFCISLFAQLQADISEHQKNEIKTIILECIISRSNSGLVRKMAVIAKRYLKSNMGISTAVFNTVVKLAEDEMKHQKFNADYILKKKPNDGFEFIPNITPKLRGVDIWIKEAKAKKEKVEKYKFQRSKIIDAYLFKQKELKLEEFNADDYDIELLCYALNCGLPIENNTVFEITKKTINAMVDVWSANEHSHRSRDILDVYTLHEIEGFLGNQLIKDTASSQRVIDVLFDGIDFSKFTKDTLEFYHNIFFTLIPQFFDAYDNSECRNFIKSVFQNVEEKIQAITESGVKDTLIKSLIFYFPQYKTHDWSKCTTKYSLDDKVFINAQLMKYGAKYLSDILLTIKQLHIEELLPEVIIPLQSLFEEARKNDEAKFHKTISEQKYRILLYISKAFIDFSEKIKQSETMTKAFEGLLDILCEYGLEEAAVILDEFRIH